MIISSGSSNLKTWWCLSVVLACAFVTTLSSCSEKSTANDTREVNWGVGYYESPTWSRNGRFMAAFFPKAFDGIWVANGKGTEARPISQNSVIDSEAGLTWVAGSPKVAYVVPSDAVDYLGNGELVTYQSICLVDVLTGAAECPSELSERWMIAGIAWHPHDSGILALVKKIDPNLMVETGYDLILWRMRATASNSLVQAPFLSSPAWSWSGNAIAYVGGDAADGTTWLGVVDVNNSQQRQLETTVGYAPDSPSWSPDGKWIVFSGRDPNRRDYHPELFIVDAGGTMQPTKIDIGDRSALQPSWSPEGNEIAYVTVGMGTNRLYVASVPPLYQPQK